LLSSLSLPVLILIFVGAAVFVWIAGIKLSDTTDVLSERLGLGEALGGLIILSIVTNLPEIAITFSAALRGNLGVATGNILGGIAIQTVVLVVLVVLDVFCVRGGHPLTYRAASLVLVLEGVLLMAILTVTVMGTQLPPSLIFWRVSPASLLIVGLWVVGLWLIGRARSDLPWREKGDAPGGQEEPHGVAKTKKGQDAQNRETSITRTAIVFAISALVTLVGGVVLEVSGDDIAGQLGMSGVLFGSTFLAAATALPEVSTGLGSVRLRDYKLAVSDIFGGNAFLPVLFLLASLLSGVAPLPQAQKTDIYLTGLGALLTMVYLYGLIFRSRLRFLHMGIDSLVALVLYGLGIAGLVAVAHG
jgi:cation:H+ antiporter